MNSQYISKVVDLTDPKKNVIYNMTHDEAVAIVKSGDVEAVRKIDGQFSLISVEGKNHSYGKINWSALALFYCKTGCWSTINSG